MPKTIPLVSGNSERDRRPPEQRVTGTLSSRPSMVSANGWPQSSPPEWPAPETSRPDIDPLPDPAPVVSKVSGAEADVETVLRLIDGIERGWNPAQLGTAIDQILLLLASTDALTASGLDELLMQLNERLSARGYRKYTLAQWRSRLKETRRAVAAVQAVQDQVQGQEARIVPQRFVALSREDNTAAGSGPQRCGIYDAEANRPITNFEVEVEQDLQVQDDVEPCTAFAGRMRLPDGREVPFQVDAKIYASDPQLKAALYSVGGSGLRIEAKLDVIRNAIADLSPARVQRKTTTNFGWTEDGSAYLVPSGRVSANGFVAAGSDTELRVDLSACPQASYLDMKPLAPGELLRVKRHVVEDLLALHRRSVTHALLGFTGAAVLRQFSGSSQRFCGWLRGESGAGKTLPAKLFQGFFGNYPPGADDRFVSWASTVNMIERSGYFFRDALYLVDDFKVSLAQHQQTTRLLQAYADGSARGRLRSDANFNVARPIRGLLLVTGENAPDDEASSTARTIVVDVPPPERKDFARRDRCLAECGLYSGVTAGFIQWLMQKRRLQEFADRMREWETKFYARAQGQPNDGRIAGNFAVLAASYLEFAEFLGQDAWPTWRNDTRAFLDEDLAGMLGRMLRVAKEQRPIELFWDTLVQLAEHERVRIDPNRSGEGRVIGKPAIQVQGTFWVSSELALGEVQAALRSQGRPELPLRPGDIAPMLRRSGLLVNRDGRPLPADGAGDSTALQRLDGDRRKCFLVTRASLLGTQEMPIARLNPAFVTGRALPAGGGEASPQGSNGDKGVTP